MEKGTLPKEIQQILDDLIDESFGAGFDSRKFRETFISAIYSLSSQGYDVSYYKEVIRAYCDAEAEFNLA